MNAGIGFRAVSVGMTLQAGNGAALNHKASRLERFFYAHHPENAISAQNVKKYNLCHPPNAGFSKDWKVTDRFFPSLGIFLIIYSKPWKNQHSLFPILGISCGFEIASYIQATAGVYQECDDEG